MADNVTYGAGNNATVPDALVQRTDDLGAAGHVPYVKLMDGTDGNSTVIPGDGSGLQVQGPVAHDSVFAGNPFPGGAHALAHGASPTAVAAGDLTKLYANRHGVPFVIGGHPNVVTTEFHFTTAQTDAALVSIGTGNKIVVTQVMVTLDEACTVGVGVRIGLATATLSAASSSGITGIVFSHPGLVPGGGAVRGDGSGILGVGADNEDLRITSEVPTSGSLRVVASHYVVPS